MDFNVKRLAADAGTFLSRAVQVNKCKPMVSWNCSCILKFYWYFSIKSSVACSLHFNYGPIKNSARAFHVKEVFDNFANVS